MIYKLLTALILIISAIEDYKKKEISNVYFFLLVILSIIKGVSLNFYNIITIIFLIFIKYIFDKYIGYGDIKIMIGLILLYNYEKVLYSFIIASIISIIYIKIFKKEKIAFLPFYNIIYILMMLIY